MQGAEDCSSKQAGEPAALEERNETVCQKGIKGDLLHQAK